MDTVNEWLAQYDINLAVVLQTLIILAVASVVILYVNRMARHLLTKLQPRLSLPYSTVLLGLRIVNVLLWVSVGLMLLNFWGISVTGVWTVLMSAAAVIGVGFLAVWTMVSNITAAFFITIWRPFDLGEELELMPEGLKGRVIDRNMMFTALREAEGTVLYVPNNFFFQKAFRVKESHTQHLFESFEERPSVTRPQALRETMPAG